jgi:DNA-nicking Smr family endonuclease
MEEHDHTDDAVEIPIDGSLDLHTFSPRDVKDLLPAYIEECRARGIYEIRVIHGKGSGALRETVHSILRKNPDVASFALDSDRGGNWGATIVQLEQPHKR